MAPSTSESDVEKPAEFASVKFLLKQVYAAHTSKVRDLETEIRGLKQQLENTKREACLAKSECEKCKTMQSAYNACKEEYKMAMLEQTRRLKELELKLFSSVEKTSDKSDSTEQEKENEVPKASYASKEVIDSLSENFTFTEFDDVSKFSEAMQLCLENRESNKPLTDSQGKLMPPPSRPLSSSATITLLKKPEKKDFVSLNSPLNRSTKLDDVVLVPDSLADMNCNSPTVLKDEKKCKATEKGITCNKENRDDASNISSRLQKSNLSKKRALSDLTLNETQNKKISKDDEKQVKSTVPESSKRDEQKVVKKSSAWGKSFEDFDFGDCPQTNSFSVIANEHNKKKGENLANDDDFEPLSANNENESGSWKSCNKKVGLKKPVCGKAIKSTSRFKMTLVAPDLNAKRPNYKQTKLTKSLFKPKQGSKKDISDADNVGNDTDEDVIEVFRGSSQEYEDNSSCAGVSELASLADADFTCIPGNYEKEVTVISPVLYHSQPLGSETFCQLEPVHSKEEQPHGHIQKHQLSFQPLHNSQPSVTCGTKEKQIEADRNNEAEIFDSFDRVPVPEEPNYKYKEETVRKKAKRKQLEGFDCKECEKYYLELDLPEEEKKERMKQCSRHRAKYAPPATPAHFWEIEFPDTDECKARGYINETQKVQLKSRRRRPLNND